VAAGVVPTEVLNTLRSKSTDDLIRDVNQLLHPITAGVVVTPVAERHLTAVLAHCKESIEMANKKAAETAAKTKKFAAPAAASKKAAKADKPAKAAASAAGDARKSSLFRLLNDTKAAWSAFTTQKGEIVAAFVKLGAVGKTAAGVTRAQLIAALPEVPDKNISFYLSKWQPAGIVEKLPAAE
jgi:ABC-type transporter Mla subunit MlaD